MNLIKTVAAAVATAQNVPFPGSRQERIAEAAITAYDSARNITTVEQLDDLPVGTTIVVYGEKFAHTEIFTKTTDGLWSWPEDTERGSCSASGLLVVPETNIVVLAFGTGE